MTEEIEPTGTKLEYAIAQAKADILAINLKCEKLQEQAKTLRIEQKELEEMLVQLMRE